MEQLLKCAMSTKDIINSHDTASVLGFFALEWSALKSLKQASQDRLFAKLKFPLKSLCV